jgi:hypothetical protein
MPFLGISSKNAEFLLRSYSITRVPPAAVSTFRRRNGGGSLGAEQPVPVPASVLLVGLRPHPQRGRGGHAGQ